MEKLQKLFFDSMVLNDYMYRTRLIERLKLGDWKYFFLRDTKMFPFQDKLDYIVDGDKHTFVISDRGRPS